MGDFDYLVASVFDVPTFSDAYKVAALDAVNRLNELSGGAFDASRNNTGDRPSAPNRPAQTD